MIALSIVCGILVLVCIFLLMENNKRKVAVQKQWEHVQQVAKRMDDLNSINMELQQKLETANQRIETATELSLLNNKFIETVKKTAEEQVAAARSRIATIQSRGVR